MTLVTTNYDLPQYSPSLAAPDYSFEPSCGEYTLQVTPRAIRPPPESTWIKRAGKATVVLHNQEENTKVPSYGRGGSVAGSILFDYNERICKVVLKVCHIPDTPLIRKDPDCLSLFRYRSAAG